MRDRTGRAELLEEAIRRKKAAARFRPTDMPPRPADQPAQLGEMQRSLWLVHQMAPDSPAYNLTSAFRIHGSLNTSELQRAFTEVVSRHRLLRSNYSLQRDSLLQIIHPQAPLSFEVLEVERGEGLAASLREASAPFDLQADPLIRLRLIQEGSRGECYLLLVLHHILADERSLDLLWQELGEAYEGRLSTTEPQCQYDDYVHWLGQRNAAERKAELDDWRRRLDPLPEDLRLPFELPAADTSTAPGRLSSRTLTSSIQQSIRHLAASIGTTPFMVYSFAFRLLLQRYTHAQRTAFATPVSTRSHPATGSMIGYFTNPLVIATMVDEEQSVEAAVSDFSRQVREALGQASVPFDLLAEALSPPRHRDRHPIFQAMFVYQETTPPPSLGDARLEPLALDLGVSKFDLSLFVTEGELRLEIAVEYRTDRYDATRMESLLDHYATLLERLPDDPDRAVTEVPMLNEQEQRWLGASAEGVELDPSGISTLLPQRILDNARRSPQAPAVSSGGVRLTYGELEIAARSIAHQLVSSGVEPGDRVGLFLDRSVLTVEAILGSHLAGAAYVPLDPSYPERRNRLVLEDAEVKAVLTTSALRTRLPSGAWSTVALDLLPPSRQQESFLPALEAQSPAYLLYTSGSTGRPKGVVVTHDNLRASTAARLQVYDTPPRRFLLLPSLAFDSSVAGIFWTLGVAGCLVIPTDEEARDGRRLAQLVSEERVTTLLCVPSLYTQLMNVDSQQLHGLETAIVAGESCPSPLVEKHFQMLPQTRLFNEYGPTEATVWATVHEAKAEDGGRPVTIGRPIPGVRVDVLDPFGRPVPVGVPGEAWIAGPTVAQGYWRRPDLTAERFLSSQNSGSSMRSYRTGDRMVWTADGRLLFLGREDEQLKLRGFRVEPGEVEEALLAYPAIEQAAVVARAFGSGATTTSSRQETQLVAFVEAASAQAVANWRHTVAERLPEFMVPGRLVVLPELPRLPNGKVDRRQLRDLAIEPDSPTSREQSVVDTEMQALISLWEGLLGRSGIGLDDNFFELGGHSLLIVAMTLAIERDFGVALTAADVFQNPTVRGIARRLSQRGGAATKPYRHLFPIQPTGGEMPFIVAVPHFFSAMFATRFRDERPVYGLRGVSLRPEGNLGQWKTMRELGEDLVEEIQRRFPDSTYILAGYSFGASMAIETARILEERGTPAHRLYLIAPMPEDFYRWGPFRLQIDGLRRPVAELSPAEAWRLYARSNSPLTHRPYQRAWRWLAIEPWRRLLCGVGRLRKLVGLPLTARILHADVRVDRFRLHATYSPHPICTPTVVFNAQEAETDAAATWRPYFLGPFTVHQTPDPHLGEASVEAARQVILEHLNDVGDC